MEYGSLPDEVTDFKPWMNGDATEGYAGSGRTRYGFPTTGREWQDLIG